MLIFWVMYLLISHVHIEKFFDKKYHFGYIFTENFNFEKKSITLLLHHYFESWFFSSLPLVLTFLACFFPGRAAVSNACICSSVYFGTGNFVDKGRSTHAEWLCQGYGSWWIQHIILQLLLVTWSVMDIGHVYGQTWRNLRYNDNKVISSKQVRIFSLLCVIVFFCIRVHYSDVSIYALKRNYIEL